VTGHIEFDHHADAALASILNDSLRNHINEKLER
jgi:hypothetical protein